MKMPWQKRATVIMAIFLVAAALRTVFILYERRQPPEPKEAPKATYQPTADDYVFLRKSYAYDVKTAAAELDGKAVWVSAGNQLPYYPYSAASRRVDFKHDAGVLAPLAELEITGVQVAEQSPATDKQVMAIFHREGQAEEYAVAIGAVSEGNYRFIVNDIFFLDDPHSLYKRWPAEVWNAIDHHEVIKGMTELQAGLSLGTAAHASPGEVGDRTIEYSNAGKPARVTFAGNHATEVSTAPSP